jgi:Homeodomain-like domain
MNKLDKTERARVIHLLCEGMSIRAITRLTGFSKTTVSKLVVDAGHAAAWYQDRVFQNLACKKLQIDEIWGFVGAKQKNVQTMKAPYGWCRRCLALARYGCGYEACSMLACWGT